MSYVLTTRILTISKPYVCGPYRKKLTLLAEDPRFEVGLVCPEEWGSQKFEEPTKEVSSKLWIKSVPTYFSNKNHFHMYKNLLKVVEEFKPDILNVEEEDYSLVTWQGFRIAKKVNAIPTFYAWQNIFKNYPPPFKNIEQYVYRNAAASMGGSDEAGVVLKQKGYKGSFETIPQVGIDMSKFSLSGDVDSEKSRYKSEIGIDPDKFTIFYAGRVVMEKGVQTLIEACANLKDKPIQLVVVGSGPYQAELKKLANEKLPENMAIFIDHVTASDVHKYIKSADLMCLCSLTRPNWKEQGPVRIITESMSAQTNVIVSSSGPLPEVVGDAGLVFPEGNSKELTARIEEFLHSKEKRDEFRKRALTRVEENYSAEAVAAKCAKLFAGLV
jgi:glycosyltransferase involved in cell wall biosynthesis